jgi:hypothetical protein
MLYLYVTVNGYTRVDGAGKMNPIKILSISLIAFAVTACGGGGSPSNTSSTTSGGGTTTTGDGTVVATGDVVGTPAIGNGTGSNYVANTIAIANAGLVDGKLAAGGQVNISVDVVDIENSSARISGTEYGVLFSSTCSDLNPAQATFDNVEIVVTQGKAETTYRAKGCSGQDLVTARLYNSTGGVVDTGTLLASAQATIDVVPPVVNDISYVSTDNQILGISKVGNPALPQVAKLIFKVSDINGDPIANQKVNFAFASGATTASLATTSQITNPDGEVTAILNAAQNRTVLRIIASTDYTDSDGQSQTTFVSSEAISVHTGFPVQKKMTLALSTLNPHGIAEAGSTSVATVYLADSYGNPPPDGTLVYFTTEGGSIGASCPTSAAGSCSVTWVGQNNIPGTGTSSVNEVNELVGFSTIMAFTQGDSDFSDDNNNGLYDVGEAFSVYSEPFRDDNFNLTRETQEPAPIDVDNNGSYTAAAGVTTYQGTLCSAAAKAAGHCATNMAIWAQHRLVMSGEVDGADGVRLFRVSDKVEVFNVSLSNSPYYLVLQDANDNIPANGTSLSVSSEGYQIEGETGPVENAIGEIGITGLPSHGDVFNFRINDDDPADNPPTPRVEFSVSQVGGGSLTVSFGIVP